MSRDSELGGAHVAGVGDQLCALGDDPLLGIVSSAVRCALGQSKFNQPNRGPGLAPRARRPARSQTSRANPFGAQAHS
jgi:hypothetical protein